MVSEETALALIHESMLRHTQSTADKLMSNEIKIVWNLPEGVLQTEQQMVQMLASVSIDRLAELARSN